MDHKKISDVFFQQSSHLSILKKVIFSSFEMTSNITQIAYTELLAGEIINEHCHDSMEEVFLLLDGECEFYLDGSCHLLKKESVIKISPKISHKIKALSITKLFYFGVEI